jgi:hypothetical protein
VTLWPPFADGGSVNCSCKRGGPLHLWATTLRRRTDEKGYFIPHSFIKRQNLEIWLHHLASRQHMLLPPACRPALLITYPMDQYNVNTNKKGRFNLNHPQMDEASTMPLIISLQEKFTNTSEVTAQCNAMF